MMTLQKMGGIAALIQAATYVVGVVLMFTLSGFAENVAPIQRVPILAHNQAITYIANLFIYVVAGIFLVVLALALYERLKNRLAFNGAGNDRLRAHLGRYGHWCRSGL